MKEIKLLDCKKFLYTAMVRINRMSAIIFLVLKILLIMNIQLQSMIEVLLNVYTRFLSEKKNEVIIFVALIQSCTYMWLFLYWNVLIHMSVP